MSHWSFDSIFYHIYPLGLCDAPVKNDLSLKPVSRLKKLKPWISYMRDLGVNALYIGPLFESSSHGYDTTDYFTLDRRLGINSDLEQFVKACHAKNIRVIFDAVFNHVSRDFFAFRDLQQNGYNSVYRDWFFTNFDQRSPYNDQFSYEGWNGHYSLVKLNLRNDAVKKYLFDAVTFWKNNFGVDGLRLDAADSMDKNFFNELHIKCKAIDPEFFLLGEVIHGDYREWANPERLDSVTNYECYKGLWSSLNDGNYFEIAYSINREFGNEGIYKQLPLYNFVDNHDVDRAASILKDPRHIYPLYILLFTMPGIPSIYYGSEFGITGKKTNNSDLPLRPALNLPDLKKETASNNFADFIKKIINIRLRNSALRSTAYQPLHVGPRQYAFLRGNGVDQIIVIINSANETLTVEFKVPFPNGTKLNDQLNPGDEFVVQNGSLRILLHPCWGRILAQ